MKRIGTWLCLLFGISLGINFIVELLSRKSFPALFLFLWNNPMVFLLNSLLFSVPFLLIFFTRRRVFVITIVAVLGLAMGMVNSVLLVFRTTPFTAADLRLFKYAVTLLPTYLTWWQMILAAIAVGLAALFCIMVWRKAPIDTNGINYKESGLVAALAVSFVWGFLNIAMLNGLVAVRFGNIGQAYEDYGFAYCFSNSLFNTGISKPEEYDQEVMAKIEEESLVPENAQEAKAQNTPNIIMVQLESFFDPMLWKNSPVKEDPIPFFRYLTRAYPSGYLSVPSVGAGTANTEFECITGMNLDFFGPGEYPYKTVLQKTVCESTAFNLKTLGYRTHAIHNNEGTFYDRYKVFPQLGFDTFTPIEYMYDTARNPTGWSKDQVLVEEIQKALEDTMDPDFVYAISVQGHGKYPSFEYYCQQLREMDNFLMELTVMLSARKEPTVLVLYGDHLPGFEWTAEEMRNQSLYQTQYVVWNNLGLPKVNRDVEAYQLSSHVLNMLDIHEGTMIRFHQRFLNGEMANLADYLNSMKILEYDMLYGDREVYRGEIPFTATKMEMGITPVIQRTTVHVADQVIVFGENFNEYSRICINGKAVPTPYIQESRLIAPDIPYREGQRITVQQIGRDKIPLGTARKGPGS